VPRIVRVPALTNPVRRTPTVRRLHRERALGAALAAAATVEVGADRLVTPSGEIVTATPELVGTLVALRTADGAVLGLGWITHVGEGTVTIATPVPSRDAAVVVVGREKYR
jgi:polynucleotide 5'-kinase involved in rRNA processing